MKRYLLFALSLSVLFLYSSCNKDDDDSVRNEFTLNGDSYQLAKGFMTEYGSNGNGSFDFDVELTSSTVNYNDFDGSFSGTGDVIYFDLNTSLETGLVNGTYNFSSDRNAFTFVDGAVATNYDADTESGDVFAVVGGSVEIEIRGNETYFSWNLTISNGTTVTGEFQGILRNV
ncbi:MAG: hypothetical protein AAFP77_31310 [Bacteroidota bacterium]